MKTKLFLFFLLATLKLSAQCDSIPDEIGNLKSLAHDKLFNDKHKKMLITNHAIDSLFNTLHAKVSGTTFKDGKYKVSSASIDDQGVTMNYGGLGLNNYAFIGFSANATSDDKLANLFSKDQNLTYAFGVNFNFFFRGFVTDSKGTEAATIRTKINSVVYNTLNDAKEAYIKNNIQDYLDYLADSNNNLSQTKLKSALMIKQYLEDLNITIEKSDIAVAGTVNAAYIDCKYAKARVKEADSLQLNAELKRRLFWISGEAKYNVKQVSILNMTTDDLVDTHINDYLSFKLALNWFITSYNTKHCFYISPTATFSNPENFKESEKQTVTVLTPIPNYVPPTDNPNSLAYTTTTASGFKERAKVINVFAVELPFMYYYKKSHVGLDIAVKAGVNDPLENNVSARFGIFVPIGLSDDKEVVTIEPLFKFQKLFNKSNPDFVKDNLVVGFNISVALPKLFK